MKKSVLFLGDSITMGVGTTKPEYSYVQRVRDALNINALNYGVSGTRIANQEGGSEYFLARAKRMPQEADFVIVFGGTNDYGHGLAPLGKATDETDDTFYGAMNNLIKYLVKKYGREKLCFILPLRRYNEDNPCGDGSKKFPVATLQEYVDIMEERLKAFDIPFIDFDQRITAPLSNKNSDFFADGLHPNDCGHRVIAEILVGYLRKQGF